MGLLDDDGLLGGTAKAAEPVTPTPGVRTKLVPWSKKAAPPAAPQPSWRRPQRQAPMPALEGEPETAPSQEPPAEVEEAAAEPPAPPEPPPAFPRPPEGDGVIPVTPIGGERDPIAHARDEDVLDAFDADAPPLPAIPDREENAPDLGTPFSEDGDELGTPKLKLSEANTLTDWLALCPGLRQPFETHPYRIRVMRVKPKVYAGLSVHGYQGYVRAITDDEFARKFGGESYTLTLEGPSPRGILDQVTGTPRIQTLAVIPSYTVAGPPNLQTLPFAEGSAPSTTESGPPMTQQPFSSPFAPPWSHPHNGASTPTSATEVRVIGDLARDAAQGERAARAEMARLFARPAGPDVGVLDILDRGAQRQIDAQRDAAAATERALKEQIDELKRQNADIVAQLRAASDPSTRMMETVFGSKMENASQQEMRREYEHRIDSMRGSFDAQLAQKEQFWTTRVDTITNEAARREESIRGEAQREKLALMENSDRRERELRDNFEVRMAAATRDRERDLELLRADHVRTVEALRRDNERAMNTSEQISKIAVGGKDAELERLRSEVASLKHENESLKREVFKDPVTRIVEAQKLAELTGMVKDEGGPEGESTAAKLGQMAMQYGPEFLRVLSPFLAKAIGMDPQSVVTPPAPHAPPQLPAHQPNPGAPTPQAGGGQRSGQQPPQRRMIRVPNHDDVGDGDLPVSGDFVPLRGQAMQQPMPQPAPVPQAPPPQQPPPPQPQPQQAAPQQAAPQPQQPPQAQQPESPHADRLREILTAKLPLHVRKDDQGNPIPPPFTQSVLQQFAVEATNEYRSETTAKAFADKFYGRVGAFALQAVHWIDGEGAGYLLDVVTGGDQSWNMAGPRQWIAEVWAELEAIEKGAAVAPAGLAAAAALQLTALGLHVRALLGVPRLGERLLQRALRVVEPVQHERDGCPVARIDARLTRRLRRAEKAEPLNGLLGAVTPLRRADERSRRRRRPCRPFEARGLDARLTARLIERLADGRLVLVVRARGPVDPLAERLGASHHRAERIAFVLDVGARQDLVAQGGPDGGEVSPDALPEERAARVLVGPPQLGARERRREHVGPWRLDAKRGPCRGTGSGALAR